MRPSATIATAMRLKRNTANGGLCVFFAVVRDCDQSARTTASRWSKKEANDPVSIQWEGLPHPVRGLVPNQQEGQLDASTISKSLVRVGNGRDFVVEERVNPRRRWVLTAADCLPAIPALRGKREDWAETFRDLIGPLGARTSVWAECLFVVRSATSPFSAAPTISPCSSRQTLTSPSSRLAGL